MGVTAYCALPGVLVIQMAVPSSASAPPTAGAPYRAALANIAGTRSVRYTYSTSGPAGNSRITRDVTSVVTQQVQVGPGGVLSVPRKDVVEAHVVLVGKTAYVKANAAYYSGVPDGTRLLKVKGLSDTWISFTD
jgi:hypothetical protein